VLPAEVTLGSPQVRTYKEQDQDHLRQHDILYGAERWLGQLVTSKPSDATISTTYDHEPSKSETWSSTGSNHMKGKTSSHPCGREPSVSRKNASLERSGFLMRIE
jgi:hypothetical protein